jgi:serine/threonine-protein kinase
MAGDGEFRRLGPYVLLRTSGAGGMGRIDLGLRAEPGAVPKLYVLKRMHAELRSPEQEARFRREASIALQLSHDAIAQTVGVEEIDGELLLLQELVHGVDLRLLETRLATARGRVPIEVAVHIVSEVARALAHAHAFGDLGIVHRDVTPDNVMLAFSGEVKLVDFGLARSDADASLTATGHVVGRPTYTAPEVWEGAQADRRADIYSLGVVLWQLLTGQRFEVARASGAKPAPVPSTLNAQVPPQLDDVASRAMARDPDQRYQSAGELHEALRAFRSGTSPTEPALAELLERHFDVARERRMLAADVERALRFLGVAVREQPAPVPQKRGRPAMIAGTGITAALAIAVVTFVGLSPSRPDRTAPPSAAAVLQAPAPAASPDGPTATPRDGTRAQAEPPLRGHPPATSARRARPQIAKAARPPSAPPAELLKRAQEQFDLGDTAAALALARQAAGAGARAPAHVLMGKALMSERHFAEAEQAFAEAVRVDPGDAEAAQLLAFVREARRGGP